MLVLAEEVESVLGPASSSVTTSVGVDSPPRLLLPAMKAYLVQAAKRLKKEASWRASELKTLCVNLIKELDVEIPPSPNTDEPIETKPELSPALDSADPYFYVFKAACETRQARLVEIALDALHYLIEHDFIKGREVIDEENQLTLMDDIIVTVCKCEDEYDEVIQLKVLHASYSLPGADIMPENQSAADRSHFHQARGARVQSAALPPVLLPHPPDL